MTKPLYCTFAKKDCTLYFTSVHPNKDQSLQNAKERKPNHDYFTINLFDPNLREEFINWLETFNVPEREIKNLLKQFAQTLESIQQQRINPERN